MKLYFAPLACSMASRIALYEAGGSAEFVYVDIHNDTRTRLLLDGADYFEINPMGQVPAVETEDGELLTENAVVLQYIADQYPESRLAPRGGLARYRLQESLNFIATELHKATFIPLLNRDSPDGTKAFARQKLPLRFGHLDRILSGRAFLLEEFTVADAYLLTVLNWAPYASIELSTWPRVHVYFQEQSKRPSVARAMAEEAKAYAEERTRGPLVPLSAGTRSLAAHNR